MLTEALLPSLCHWSIFSSVNPSLEAGKIPTFVTFFFVDIS